MNKGRNRKIIIFLFLKGQDYEFGGYNDVNSINKCNFWSKTKGVESSFLRNALKYLDIKNKIHIFAARTTFAIEIMDKISVLFKEWQSLQPLKESDKIRLDQKFMLDFNYNSNHIEGNTLTYGQTEMLLMFGRVVESAMMKDLEEMKASNVGLKMVKVAALDKEQPLSEYFIRTLHQTLLREDYTVYRQLPDGTNTSYTVHAGQYKTRPNSVITATGERFEYASPEETPALMTDLLQWYNEAEAEGILSPIELAALFHYRYIRIHPFEDGNGRISRLIVNYILYRHGYPMIVVQSADKDNYLIALNRCDIVVGPVPSDGARAELSQITPFVEYLGKCLERALTVCIQIAKGEKCESNT